MELVNFILNKGYSLDSLNCESVEFLREQVENYKRRNNPSTSQVIQKGKEKVDKEQVVTDSNVLSSRDQREVERLRVYLYQKGNLSLEDIKKLCFEELKEKVDMLKVVLTEENEIVNKPKQQSKRRSKRQVVESSSSDESEEITEHDDKKVAFKQHISKEKFEESVSKKLEQVNKSKWFKTFQTVSAHGLTYSNVEVDIRNFSNLPILANSSSEVVKLSVSF
ncbi:hypothetical protein L1987_06146 [Smallanthus sonchifolius]|uniref:Uncharacterized protein n=1 Tax=Smallanthus sonchifolius TaxID=185202 RepID=A0ACB9JXE7_9ASTR|nr:hypothetical protein L1987_06146 [Smallanthus sonchifolius]